MRHISLVIPAISCNHCKDTVETTLKQFEGVQEAIVDVANSV
ncbi:MAG TPA: cation transporter [Chloroflexia bacterium]|jgi:copper chaperone CopZ